MKPRSGSNLSGSTIWSSKGWLPELLLIVLIILAYRPAWNAGFVWDDDRYVTKNPLLSAPDGLQRIWFSSDAPSQYCPMVYTIFRIERSLWGLNASGYHWVNILVHAANAVLVLRLLNKLRVPGAWLGAALFALHPVQVESVAWITELKNLLSLFFYLLALTKWSEFVDRSNGRAWRVYGLALVLFALALLSKTTACTLPVAMMLLLWLRREPITRARLFQIAPFVALSLAMGLVTMWWERFHQGTAGGVFIVGWLDRILIASRAIFFYLGKLGWPLHLTFSYPRWNISPHNPLAYCWLLALGSAFVGILLTRRFLNRGVTVALAFYIITLGPLLGFIMLYTFRYSFVADHYQYTASIGPLALCAAAVTTQFSKVGKQFRMALIVCVLTTLGYLTYQQCRIYANEETLWRATLAQNPDSFMAHNNLGAALLRRGDSSAAIRQFEEVLRLQPDYEVAYYNLGNAALYGGHLDEAISQYRKAVELNWTYPDAHTNLGNVLLQQGQTRDALEHYDVAWKLKPKSASVAGNLAWILATSPDSSLRNGAEAVKIAEQAVRLSYGRDPALIGTLAAAYAEAGRFSEAINTADRALGLARSQRNQHLVQALSLQQSLYRADTPFRDSVRTGPVDKL